MKQDVLLNIERHSRWLQITFTLILLCLLAASCNSDVIIPNKPAPALTGVIRDSAGNPISNAGMHILHYVNSEQYPEGGVGTLDINFQVPSEQIIGIRVYEPDYSLDTVFAPGRYGPGTWDIYYTPQRIKMNGLSFADIQGETFRDTLYFVTESVDFSDLKSEIPIAESNTDGRFAIDEQRLQIGKLVVSPSIRGFDTIAHKVEFIVLRSGYQPKTVTFTVNPDSSQSHDIILQKE